MSEFSASSRSTEAPGLDEARRVATVAIENQPPSTTFTARNVLDQQPWLLEFPSVVMDLAYEEYCQRAERGEQVGVAEFSQRYPEIEEPLVRQLAIHEMLVSAHPEGSAVLGRPVVPGPFLHYELLQELGRGGAATVYLARDHHMGEALRVLKVARTTARECVPLAQLSHPGIVFGLYREPSTQNEVETLCMPVIGRWTLHNVLELSGAGHDLAASAGGLWQQLADKDDIPMEWREPRCSYADLAGDSRTIGELFVDWSRQVADALAYAHSKGIIHCDIKPSNILIAWDGRAVILDFNTAQACEVGEARGGTLPFMSPEQLTALCQKPTSSSTRLTPATDLFGWGATVYSLVTGHPPFAPSLLGGTQSAAIEEQLHHRREGIDRQRLYVCGAPSALVELITSCLDSDPRQRPPSADAIVQKLTIDRSRNARRQRVVRRRLVIATVAVLFVGAIASWGSGAFQSSVDRSLNQGWQAIDRQDWATAFQAFDAVAKRAPQRNDARVGLAWTLIQQRQYEPALAELEQLPASVEVERLQAYVLLASKRSVDTAREFYERLIESRQATPGDLCNAGYCELVGKDTSARETARRYLQEAIQREPTFTTAWSNLLYLDRNESRLQQALPNQRLISEAVAQAGTSLDVWLEVFLSRLAEGAFLQKQGSSTEQATCWDLAVQALLRAAELGLTQEAVQLAKLYWPDFCASSEFRAISARLPSGPTQLAEARLAAPHPGDLASLRAAFSE